MNSSREWKKFAARTMNVLSVPNWTVNFSSFHIDISLRKKWEERERKRVVLEEAGEWDYRTDKLVSLYALWGKRVLLSSSWTGGGIILACFRILRTERLLKVSFCRILFGCFLGCSRMCILRTLELRWLWVCVSICVWTCNFLTRP